MDGHLCLKWNNHSSAFLKSISSVQIKEKYCDATIVCQEKYYAVHRFILSTCSDYFEEIFERIQCEHPYIVFRDIEAVDMELLLNYMYQGEVNVVQEKLPTLIKTAEALKVKGLAVPDDISSKDDFSMTKKRSKNSDGYIQSKKKLRGKSVSEPCNSLASVPAENSSKNCEISQSEDENLPLPTTSIKREIMDTFEFEGSSPPHSNDNRPDVPPSELKSCLKEDPQQMENENIFSTSEHEFQPDTFNSQLTFWSNFNDVHSSQNVMPQNSREQETSIMNQEHPAQLLEGKEGNEKARPFEPNQSFSLCHNKFSREIQNHLYKCPSCDYKSNELRIIKIHLRTRHSQERPFQCQHCLVRFNKKAYLRIHLRMHTGERPYSCQICAMKFSTKSNLNRHKKSFHSQNMSS